MISPNCHAALLVFFFFFNDTATTEIYPLSLHDALPISPNTSTPFGGPKRNCAGSTFGLRTRKKKTQQGRLRSEEHTSELQSPCNLVCRLLLEKKKKNPDRTDAKHLPRNRAPCGR